MIMFFFPFQPTFMITADGPFRASPNSLFFVRSPESWNDTEFYPSNWNPDDDIPFDKFTL